MAGRIARVRSILVLVALALGACAGPRETGAPVAPPGARADRPPTTNGLYVFAGCEGEGGCQFQNWRAVAVTPVRAAATATSAVIGTVTRGEWVRVETIETHLIPKRGVVRAGSQTFRVGEVIYALEYQGEGYLSIWHRGAPATLDPDEPVEIAWDEPAPSPRLAAELGTWVRVRRETGQVGWIRLDRDAPTQFECMGPLAGDADCRG